MDQVHDTSATHHAKERRKLDVFELFRHREEPWVSRRTRSVDPERRSNRSGTMQTHGLKLPSDTENAAETSRHESHRRLQGMCSMVSIELVYRLW